ncbi:MAG TPA: hypothetical protein VD994_13135 [Prosthecobacter sp.]|nr:hypothetical protein [Prosthecobacter sp.]
MKHLNDQRAAMRGLVRITFAMLLVSGCVTPREEKVRMEINPMPQIWAGIVEGILTLERRRAPRPEWRAAAEFEEVVRSRKDLEKVVDGLALDDLTEVEAVALYQRSRLVAHYGFEGNFHALVFFDGRGRALKVLR